MTCDMPLTAGEAWRRAGQRIGRQEARLLLEHVCGCTHATLIAHPEQVLSKEQTIRFEGLVQRRLGGEPFAYLVGSAWFMGLEFVVDPAVLVPRPETELLVDLAARHATAGGWAQARLVDLGTGSGIVAVMIARRCPHAELTAVDLSAGALAVAKANAARHGAAIRFLQGDWFAPLKDERFDLIVANPPYVAEGDPHLDLNGLPFEPRQALTDGIAGGDGLECIRRIVTGAGRHLVPRGALLMEHGYDQAVEVRRLLQEAGFCEVASWRDDAGIERVSGGRLPG